MRLQLLAPFAVVVAVAAAPLSGQARLPDPRFGGNGVRVTVGQSSVLGGARDWSRGLSVGLAWEAWDPGSTGELGRVALGIGGSFGRLPFSESHFLEDSRSSGLLTTAAQAPAASMFDLQATLRIRGPEVVVVPSFVMAVGYYNFMPGKVAFQGTDTSGTAQLRGQSGPAASLGFAIDGPYVGRAALFGEAIYSYDYSSESQLPIRASGACAGARCDAFRNTQTGTVRVGLRIRVDR